MPFLPTARGPVKGRKAVKTEGCAQAKAGDSSRSGSKSLFPLAAPRLCGQFRLCASCVVRQGAVCSRSGSHRRCPGSWGAASSVPGGRRLRPARHRLCRPRPPVSVQPPPVFNVLYLHHCNHLAKHAGSRLPARRRRHTWTRRLSLRRSVLEINHVFVRFDPRSPVLFICFNPYPVHDILPVCLLRLGRHWTILFPCMGPFLSWRKPFGRGVN